MAEPTGSPPPTTRSLSRLNAPEWQALPDYNEEVRDRLYACEKTLKDGRAPLRAFADVYTLLAPIRQAHMCRPQRVRVSWLLAMAYAGVEDHLQALQELDDAILAAADLEDEDALADLLDLRGSLNVSVQRFHEAQEDYGDAAAMRQSQRLEGHLDERDADEARVLQQHASTLYLLAQPQEAAAALSRARELLRHAPNDVGLAIVIEYTQAHLDRIFGGPDDALLPALHAASYFAAQGPNHANTAARTHLFSAEVALDMVARLDAARDRAAFLQMARAHLQEARRLAEQAQQQSADGSVGLVRLGEQRLARLTSGPAARAAARERAIQQVLRDAEAREDLLLLAEAHTALADDLAAQEHMSEALAHYERTLQIVAQTEAPVLAIPARRALHAYREQHPGPIRPDLPEDDVPPAG